MGQINALGELLSSATDRMSLMVHRMDVARAIIQTFSMAISEIISEIERTSQDRGELSPSEIRILAIVRRVIADTNGLLEEADNE
jgi:hypothetical protein